VNNLLSTKFRLTVAAALFASASAASAADFTFNVPVSLKSISPPDVAGYVYCQVYSTVPPPGLGNIPAGSASMGAGSTPFTLAKGGYAGTVAVAVDVSAGKDPANARGYICHLMLGGQRCVVSPDSQPCRGAAAAGNSVEVKGEITPR
jgi:hypothetical protein